MVFSTRRRQQAHEGAAGGEGRQTVAGARVLTCRAACTARSSSSTPRTWTARPRVEIAPGVVIDVHSQAILRVVDEDQDGAGRSDEAHTPLDDQTPLDERPAAGRRRPHRVRRGDPRPPGAARRTARTDRGAPVVSYDGPPNSPRKRRTFVASSSPVKHAWRIAARPARRHRGVLFGLNAVGVYGFGKSSWAPSLALDLQGGTQIILSAQTADGKDPSADQLDQAAQIIRQRVDASGVGEARDHHRGRTQHRGVDRRARPTRPPRSASRRAPRWTSAPCSRPPTRPTSFVGGDGKSTPYPTPAPDLPSTPTRVADRRQRPGLGHAEAAGRVPRLRLQDASATRPGARPTSRSSPATPAVRRSTCSVRSRWPARRSPTRSAGMQTSRASHRPVGRQPDLQRQGHRRVRARSASACSADARTAPRNQFAIVLDGKVISAPTMNAAITDGKPQITGILHPEQPRRASPTSSSSARCRSASRCRARHDLRHARLAAAAERPDRRPHRPDPGRDLLAFQYRALGLVIVASIAVSAVLTYVIDLLLSWQRATGCRSPASRA